VADPALKPVSTLHYLSSTAIHVANRHMHCLPSALASPGAFAGATWVFQVCVPSRLRQMPHYCLLCFIVESLGAIVKFLRHSSCFAQTICLVVWLDTSQTICLHAFQCTSFTACSPNAIGRSMHERSFSPGKNWSLWSRNEQRSSATRVSICRFSFGP
jgi:hypothetical protein